MVFASSRGSIDLEQISTSFGNMTGGLKSLFKCKALTPFRHTFSHYHLQVQPVQMKGQVGVIKEQHSQWLSPQAAGESLALPIPMQKVLAAI
jgi:adenine-specific DNA glycosylase